MLVVSHVKCILRNVIRKYNDTPFCSYILILKDYYAKQNGNQYGMKMVGLEHEEKMSESFWKERSIKSAPITLTSGG